MSEHGKKNIKPTRADCRYELGAIEYTRKGLITLYAGFTIALAPHSAVAETWIGQTNGSWYQSSNWQGGVIPGPGTATTTVDNGTFAAILKDTANAGGTLNIGNSGSGVGIDGGATLNFGTANLTGGGQMQIISGTINGNINLNNGQFLFMPAAGSTVSYDGAFSGTNSSAGGCSGSTVACPALNMRSGTTVLNGQSTYSGQTAISSGATLRLGNANALSNSLIIVQQNGTLALNGGNATIGGLTDPNDGGGGNVSLGSGTLTLGHSNESALFSGVIAGTGGLVKEGTGTQVLTGTNTYTGLTSIQGGILRIGDGGTLGSVAGDVAVSSNANLVFKRSDNLAMGGNISGGGALTQAGGGVLTLSGTNTYSGGTLVQAGTLAGDARSLQGTITNNAQVVFHQAGDGTYAGAMLGSGGLLKDGAGTLTLTGTNGYGGGTTVSAGTLVGNSDSLQGNITNNAKLVFDQTMDGEYDGILSGSGTLVKDGAGSLALSGVNTYTGGTTVNAGILVGDNLSLPGNITNNAQVAFLQDDDGTYSGVISGTGGLVKAGAGTLTLTNASTYSGNTFIDEGTLALSGSGKYGFAGNVHNNAAFSVNQATVEYRGDFVNNGAYSSNQSINQFNGLTVGSNGYLAGGSQDQFIVAGDFLNTSGQAKQWKTDNATLVFTGNPGTQHAMQLAGADKGAASDAAQKNFAWGAVKLDSGNLLELTNGNAQGKQPALYVQKLVLPGGKAELANITSNYNVYFNSSLAANSYLQGPLSFGGGTGQILAWNASPQLAGTPEQPIPLTPDQQNFAQSLDQSCTGGAQGELAQRCLQLQGLNPEEKQQAAKQLTPDQVPAQSGIVTQFQSQRMNNVLGRLSGLRHGTASPLAFNFNGLQITSKQLAALGPGFGGGGAAGDEEKPAQAAEEPFRDSPLSAFVQGQFTFGDMADNEWQRGYHFDSRNVTFGTDYRFNDRLVAGMMFNYINTNAQYAQNAGGMNSNAYMGAIYGSYYLPMDFFVDLAANYGGQDYGFTRTYSYPGFAGQAKSNPGGGQFGFTLNAGKDFAYQGWQFSPYTRFEYTNLHIDAYRESGGEGFAMSVGGQTAHSFVSDLGTQISHNFSTSFGVLTPTLRVEWEHQYLNNDRPVQMSLIDAAPAQSSFVIQTGRPDRDYINLGGSLVATLPNGGSGFLRYESRLGQSDISQHIVEFGVRMSF